MLSLVTGGTSSIGKVLVRQLADAGERTRVLVRPASSRAFLDLPGVEFAEGDVTDAESVRRAVAGCQRVYHLAAVVTAPPGHASWDAVNVEGCRHVFSAARDGGVESVVFVSTIAALGWTEPDEVADESRPRLAHHLWGDYARTKILAEEILNEEVATGRGLRGCTVHPGFGYGPSRARSHSGITEDVLLRMAAGRRVPLLLGSKRLTLSYFADTARGCRLAAERGRPGEGYVLGGDHLTLAQITRGAAAALGRSSPLFPLPVSALRAITVVGARLTGRWLVDREVLNVMRHDWCFSSAKAERELGWRSTPFEQGIRETWRDRGALDLGSSAS